MIHRQWRHACRILPGSLLLLVMFCSMLRAQAPLPLIPPPAPPPERQKHELPIAPPCTDCYKGFTFDSVFRIGAHFNGAWSGAAKIAKDSLHIEITQLYNQRSSLRGILDSTKWTTIWADSATDYPTWRVLKRGRWLDSVNRQFWRDIRAADLKVIVGPGWIPVISKSTEMSEAYFGQAGKDTYTKGDWDDPRNDTVHRVDYFDFGIADTMDREKDKFIWGGTFFKAAQDTAPVLMAGAHQYTQMALGAIDTSVYDLVGRKSDAGKYDISVAMKTSLDDPTFINLPPNGLIAYVKIYRRIPVGQDACGCQLYEVIDSLPITKAMYQDLQIADTSVGNNYRDFIFSRTFPEPTFLAKDSLKIERKPGEIITALVAGNNYPKYTPRGGFKAWYDGRMAHGNENDIVGYGRYCKRLRDSLVARGYYTGSKIIDRTELVPYADISYDVYTTKKVDVTFLRGRIAPHAYQMVRKGVFNAAILADVDSVRADTTYQRQLFRFGVVDEHTLSKYRGYMDVASRVQRDILLRDPNDKRGLWANPMSDASSFRVLTGDLDTTQIRMVHMAANQIYNFGGRIPIPYANPDSMIYRSGPDSGRASSALGTGLYRATPTVNPPHDWAQDRMIAFNTPNDYRAYIDSTIHSIDIRRDQLVSMTNVSRFMFRHIRREPYPVYSVVQVHGYLGFDDNGYTNDWGSFRPPTPEEITAQSWLVLNTGCDGMWFSDFCYDDAHEFGVVHWLTGDHSTNYQTGLNSGDPYKINPARWTLPLIWTGFKDRFNAVKRVADEFRDNILPVYQKLDHNGIRMAAYRDTNFYAMPMLDTIYTQRASRDKNGQGKYQPLIETVGGKSVFVYDSVHATYLEATVFSPGPYDTARYSRYLLVTNLRCWPVDYLNYSGFSDSLYKLNVPSDSNRFKGFGAIDVRRPFVVLKNSTGIVADSAVLQRIGDTTRRTVAFGVPVALDWLEPGWGAMYRITPVIAPVSAYGTAYNNAVHALNPSVDGRAHDRLVVYERDSAVYLRTLDSNGRWGKEYLISNPTDTVGIALGNSTYRNTADNISPAIDMLRSSGSSCMIVWERHDRATDLVTVESAWLPSKPERDSFPASNTIVRTRLSTPRKLVQSWMKLSPSVTGVDSGYVVSWAAPDYTVEVKAVRDNPVNGRFDTSRVLRVKMPPPPGLALDSACGYPTLAYVRNWSENIVLNGGVASALTDTTSQRTMPASLFGQPDTLGSYHVLHIAYEQGARAGNPRRRDIYYNKLGVTFPPLPPASNRIPEVWASPTEEVSVRLQGCNFMYPSIAVDSQRVGVTFTRQWSVYNIVLRFRNTTNNPKRGWPWWNTTAYQWGGGDFRNGAGFPFPISFRDYERSSFTLFPSRPKSVLKDRYEGGLTWQWINSPDQRKNPLRFYRLGNYTSDTLPDGAHPSMMLVPCVGDNAQHAMGASGVFRRGPDASSFIVQRRNNLDTYFPAFMENTPANPDLAFVQGQETDSIFSEFDIRSELFGPGCTNPAAGGVGGGIILRPVDNPHGFPPDRPGTGYPPTVGPGMPPTFFPTDSVGVNAVESLNDIMDIVRTPVFAADTMPVVITRVLYGNEGLLPWLNMQPYDTAAGKPANIYFGMQVVRAENGAVLWNGDTISARGIGEDTLIEAITIPMTGITPGTLVYVRLAVGTSPWMHYDLAGGYHFLEGDVSTSFPKLIRRDEKTLTSSTAEGMLSVRMIPNPVHAGRGELRVVVMEAGAATVAVYDLLGSRVLALPLIEFKRAGEYAVPVDLSSLRDGLYVVDVRSGKARGSTRVTLVR